MFGEGRVRESLEKGRWPEDKVNFGILVPSSWLSTRVQWVKSSSSWSPWRGLGRWTGRTGVPVGGVATRWATRFPVTCRQAVHHMNLSWDPSHSISNAEDIGLFVPRVAVEVGITYRSGVHPRKLRGLTSKSLNSTPLVWRELPTDFLTFNIYLSLRVLRIKCYLRFSTSRSQYTRPTYLITYLIIPPSGTP